MSPRRKEKPEPVVTNSVTDRQINRCLRCNCFVFCRWTEQFGAGRQNTAYCRVNGDIERVWRLCAGCQYLVSSAIRRFMGDNIGAQSRIWATIPAKLGLAHPTRSNWAMDFDVIVVG